MSPPPPWNFPLHYIPPNFQPLPPLFNIQLPPLMGLDPSIKNKVNKHLKRQETGPEEFVAGADQEVLSLNHQKREVGSHLRHFKK